MTPVDSKALHGVLRIVLLFVCLVGSAAWGVYWVMFRVPSVPDFRIFAVGLLLAVVLGWWTRIALGVALVLSAAIFFLGDPPDLRLQMACETWVFAILGMGWGFLARLQFQTPVAASRPAEPAFSRPVATASPAAASVQPAPRSTGSESFQPRRLMDGFDEVRPSPAPPPPPPPPAAPVQEAPPPSPEPSLPFIEGTVPSTPTPDTDRVSLLPGMVGPLSEPSVPAAFLPVPPPVAPFASPDAASQIPDRPKLVPPPRPTASAPLAEYGGESVYLGSLPGGAESIAGQESSRGGASAFPPFPPAPFGEPSVAPVPDFPTMELPVNSLLRPPVASPGSTGPHSSSGPASHHGPSSTVSDGGSDQDGGHRTSGLLRPETNAGASWETLLEWYNQFSWFPWSASELEKKYRRPGVQVGWETLALQDLTVAWKTWRQGCVPAALAPGQIELRSLEGFLRCEVLGVLRHQGFPDLHVLSTAEGDAWTAVYAEVRSRMRGGEARIHRVDRGEPLVDPETGLVGRPDRLAEIRGEFDVVALVTPFSTHEGLSWSGVYALAQYQLAQQMNIVLSGVPVVVNLTLPIWDERHQSRVSTVEDIKSERRRLDVALERFRRVLSGQVPPRPQTQGATCCGCGWRHHCPSYGGARPRLDLSNPPPRLSAALK